MRQKPDLPDAALIAGLRDAYGLRAVEVAFLPLGADRHTAVYRVVADDRRAYFLKLRSGDVDEVAVALPRLLGDRGVAQVIPPLPTSAGRLWTSVDRFRLVVYPFVAGRDGHEVPLSDAQWRSLGAALSAIHTARLPEPLAQRIPIDTFAPVWRDRLRRYQARIESQGFDEPAAAELAALGRAEREPISALARRHEELADALRARPLERVLCHGDLHSRNVLIDPDGALYAIDWDTLVIAPRERDFEQIGSRWGGARELALVTEGYGPIVLDPTALAYYRYNRIVEDIAVVCEVLLDSHAGGANRAQELAILADTLRPGGALEIARRLDEG